MPDFRQTVLFLNRADNDVNLLSFLTKRRFWCRLDSSSAFGRFSACPAISSPRPACHHRDNPIAANRHAMCQARNGQAAPVQHIGDKMRCLPFDRGIGRQNHFCTSPAATLVCKPAILGLPARRRPAPTACRPAHEARASLGALQPITANIFNHAITLESRLGSAQIAQGSIVSILPNCRFLSHHAPPAAHRSTG